MSFKYKKVGLKVLFKAFNNFSNKGVFDRLGAVHKLCYATGKVGLEIRYEYGIRNTIQILGVSKTSNTQVT